MQDVQSSLPPAQALKKFEGDFYSDELHALYTVAGSDGRLVLTYPGGTLPLEADAEGASVTGFPFGVIHYQYGAEGSCTGFTVSSGRVRNLQFTRVALAAR